MQLGRQLNKRIKELGLTQIEVAKQTGLTQQTINKYVRGRGKPGYNAMVSLSRLLKVHPAWFFEEREPESPIPYGTAPWYFHSATRADQTDGPAKTDSPSEQICVIGHFMPMQRPPLPARRTHSGIITSFYKLFLNRLVEWIDGQMYESLAVNWKRLDDSWLFQLREGVRFHDGRPLTPEDVVWSYEQYLKHTPQEQWILGVQAIDGDFVQILLKKPCRLEHLAMPFVLPAGTEEASNRWVGTGPFEVVELTRDCWRLRANPHYFLSKPHLGEIQVREYENPEALKVALGEGEVHLAIGVYSLDKNLAASADPLPNRYHLDFILKEPLVQNPDLRRAIALALDREELAKAIELKAPLYSVGAFDLMLADGVHHPPEPDVKAAKALLQTVPDLQNTTLRVNYSSNMLAIKVLARVVVQQLNRVGIRAKIGDDPHALVVVRPVASIETESRIWRSNDHRNLSGYSNPQVDKLIDACWEASPTPGELRKLRRTINKDMPGIPLFYYELPQTHVKRLCAPQDVPIGLSGMNAVHTWRLEADAEKEK